MNFNQLTGRAEDHLTWSKKLGIWLYPGVEEGLLGLKNKAYENGFDLRIASGHRNYERQKIIWNEKALGKRPLLDESSNPISIKNLNAKELVQKILIWSALPGASRHHWGTDFDLYCHKSIPRNYRLQLSDEEYGPGGILYSFASWLEKNLKEFNFFRPYQEYLGGVMPEPWHISHGLSVIKFIEAYSFEIFLKNIKNSDLELALTLRENAEILYKIYFLKINKNPWSLKSIS